LALERRAILHTRVLIATFRCDAPARCGAFADERRVVAATPAAGMDRPACVSLVAPFAAGVAAWSVAGR
jgi:hypothetical protein